MSEKLLEEKGSGSTSNKARPMPRSHPSQDLCASAGSALAFASNLRAPLKPPHRLRLHLGPLRGATGLASHRAADSASTSGPLVASSTVPPTPRAPSRPHRWLRLHFGPPRSNLADSTSTLGPFMAPSASPRATPRPLRLSPPRRRGCLRTPALRLRSHPLDAATFGPPRGRYLACSTFTSNTYTLGPLADTLLTSPPPQSPSRRR